MLSNVLLRTGDGEIEIAATDHHTSSGPQSKHASRLKARLLRKALLTCLPKFFSFAAPSEGMLNWRL